MKMSTCNLHGTNTRAGITGRVENISLRQFIASSVLKYQNTHPEIWLESGSLIFGPLDAEAAMALPNPDFHVLQDRFLRIHDKKTKRLWFLWSVNELKTQPTVVGNVVVMEDVHFLEEIGMEMDFSVIEKQRKLPLKQFYRCPLRDRTQGLDRAC